MKKSNHLVGLLTVSLSLLLLIGCGSNAVQTSDTAKKRESQSAQEARPPQDEQSKKSQQGEQGEKIGEDQAKQIALERAGISEADAQHLKVKYDYDDGRAEYEVEWDVGQTEYDCDVDAYTGEILNYEEDFD